MSTSEVASLLRRVTAWAASRPDVVALALVGSHARGTAGPGSDVDLVLLTSDPARYVAEDGWVAELGLGPTLRRREWGVVVERRLRPSPGLELDVAIAAPSWAALDPVDPGTRRVVGDGMSILHDPHGLLAALTAAVRGEPGL